MKYQVLIEDSTLEEILTLGLMDSRSERIKVRALDEHEWQVMRDYPFPFTEMKNRSRNEVPKQEPELE